MAIPPGAAITAGASLLGDFMTNIGAASREKQARRFNRQMWELQNRYNHPVQQMARLQEAGLNPRLIYGSSPGGAAGNAGAIPAGKAPDYKISGANAVAAYQNARMVTAQTQNLNQMRKLNMARTIDAIASGQTKKFNLNLRKKAEASLLKGLFAESDQKRAQADKALQELDILNQQEKDLVAEAAVRVENLRKEGQIKDKDLLYATWRAEMAGKGVNVNDPVLLRTILTLLKNTGALDWIEEGIKDYVEKAKNVPTSKPVGKRSKNAQEFFNPNYNEQFGGFRPLQGYKF